MQFLWSSRGGAALALGHGTPCPYKQQFLKKKLSKNTLRKKQDYYLTSKLSIIPTTVASTAIWWRHRVSIMRWPGMDYFSGGLIISILGSGHRRDPSQCIVCGQAPSWSSEGRSKPSLPVWSSRSWFSMVCPPCHCSGCEGMMLADPVYSGFRSILFCRHFLSWWSLAWSSFEPCTNGRNPLWIWCLS